MKIVTFARAHKTKLGLKFSKGQKVPAHNFLNDYLKELEAEGAIEGEKPKQLKKQGRTTKTK